MWVPRNGGRGKQLRVQCINRRRSLAVMQVPAGVRQCVATSEHAGAGTAFDGSNRTLT